jgi:hypothetical protein
VQPALMPGVSLLSNIHQQGKLELGLAHFDRTSKFQLIKHEDSRFREMFLFCFFVDFWATFHIKLNLVHEINE